MAFAGRSEKKEHVTAAIAANIWMSFEKNSRAAMDEESLDVIVLECEVSRCGCFEFLFSAYRACLSLQEGRVLIKKVANLLLCIYAQKSVGLGLLKAKVSREAVDKPRGMVWVNLYCIYSRCAAEILPSNLV